MSGRQPARVGGAREPVRKCSVLSKGLLSALSSDCFQRLVAFPSMFLDPQAINCWGFLRKILKSSTTPPPPILSPAMLQPPLSPPPRRSTWLPYSSVLGEQSKHPAEKANPGPWGPLGLICLDVLCVPLEADPLPQRLFSAKQEKSERERGEQGGRRARRTESKPSS